MTSHQVQLLLTLNTQARNLWGNVSYSCPMLDVQSANIVKNIEDMMIREHKLTKRTKKSGGLQRNVGNWFAVSTFLCIFVPPKKQNIMQQLLDLYRQWSGHDPLSTEQLPGAGSNRAYYRFWDEEGKSVVGVIGTSRDENHAFIYLARHFTKRQLPVPQVLAVSGDELRYLAGLGQRVALRCHPWRTRCGRSLYTRRTGTAEEDHPPAAQHPVPRCPGA